MTDCTLAEVAAVLKNANTVFIACHVRPDGDAIGSGLALCLALKKAGKQAYMLCEDEPPARLQILPAIKTSLTAVPQGVSPDLFVAVDSAELNRIGVFSQYFQSFKGNTLNIDHHVSNPGYAKYNYVLPESTATCEIMPEVLKAAGWEIDREMADLLALGLLTDSGNFTHNDVSAKTFSVAAELKECGADFGGIGYQMFTRQTKGRALLYSRVLGGMRFALEDKLAILTVSKKDLEETGTDKSQTEGFVDFPLSIDGVEVAISLLEVNRMQYKASLRSKRADVNAVAAKFGGGGHVLASGCMLFGEYEEIIERLTFAVYQQL